MKSVTICNFENFGVVIALWAPIILVRLLSSSLGRTEEVVHPILT